MCLLSRNPGRVMSEGTVVVWTIFDHLTLCSVSPEAYYCGGLRLPARPLRAILLSDINVKE